MNNPDSEENNDQSLLRVSIPNEADKLTYEWGSVNYVNEHPDDKKHRLEQEAYNACHQRWRMNFIIFITVLGLVFVVYICFQTLNDPQLSSSDKRWATVFLSSIVTGSIGFLTGKAVS